jgi:hypothetical protein
MQMTVQYRMSYIIGCSRMRAAFIGQDVYSFQRWKKPVVGDGDCIEIDAALSSVVKFG